MTCRLSANLEQGRSPHSAADAHADYHVLHSAPAPFQQRMADQARARHTEGMADRDSAAVDVEPIVGDAQPVAAVQDLACLLYTSRCV